MAAAVSSFEQAYWDLLGKRAGMPVWMLLGGAYHDRITSYSNINRAVVDRRLSTWREKARSAVSMGFTGIKVAPFDGVDWRDGDSSRTGIDHGCDVVAAVRDTIGPRVRLMVDCHWRFNVSMAMAVIDRLAAYDIFWIEGIIPERPDTFPDLARLRFYASERNVLLAGGEYLSGMHEHTLALEKGVFDVINPDIRYCGGPGNLLRLGHMAGEKGIAFSPHNPDGPIHGRRNRSGLPRRARRAHAGTPVGRGRLAGLYPAPVGNAEEAVASSSCPTPPAWASVLTPVWPRTRPSNRDAPVGRVIQYLY